MPKTNLTPQMLSRGYSIALLSALLLSTTSIFIRYLTQTYQIPSLVLALWRNVFVVIVLVTILATARPDLLRTPRRHMGYLVLYGLALALFNSLWTLSVTYNGASVATVLAYSSVAFTTVLGWWFLKEGLGWIKAIAVFLSLAGCLLVSGALEQSGLSLNLVGILTGILSGLFYAIYSLMGRSASNRGIQPWTTLLYTFGFAVVFLFIINILPIDTPGAAENLTDLMWLGKEYTGWGLLFLLAAVPTLGGFGLYNVSLSYLPSSVANLILTTEPVFTAVIAYVLLDERLNGMQIAGSLLILAGVILLRIYGDRHTRNATSQKITGLAG